MQGLGDGEGKRWRPKRWVLVGPAAIGATGQPEEEASGQENPHCRNGARVMTLDPWRQVFARDGGWKRQIARV